MAGYPRHDSLGAALVAGVACAALLAAGLLPAAALAGGHGGGGHGAEKPHAAMPKLKPRRARLPADVRRDDQKYCYNIADAAKDARYARQKARLQEMEQRLKKLLRRLEKKRAEYEDWVQRRERIRKRMSRAMIDVYAKMEPEAAAAQVAQMEYAVAVALLTGLGPAKASAILNEMDPKKAGRLVNVIVDRVAEATTRKETN